MMINFFDSKQPKNEPLILRDATDKDGKNLSKLFKETFKETYGDNFSEADLEQTFGDNFINKDFIDELSNKKIKYFVIENSNKELIGVVKIRKKDENQHILDNSYEQYYLDKLYLLKNYQKQGLSIELLRAAVNWIEQKQTNSATTLDLLVWDKNPAIKFYSELDWMVIYNENGTKLTKEFELNGKKYDDIVMASSVKKLKEKLEQIPQVPNLLKKIETENMVIPKSKL